MRHDTQHYMLLSQAYAAQALAGAYNPYVDHDPEATQAQARTAATLAFIASGHVYHLEKKEWIMLYEKPLGALLDTGAVSNAKSWCPIRLPML
jgi:hypothetical protein